MVPPLFTSVVYHFLLYSSNCQNGPVFSSIIIIIIINMHQIESRECWNICLTEMCLTIVKKEIQNFPQNIYRPDYMNKMSVET